MNNRVMDGVTMSVFGALTGVGFGQRIFATAPENVIHESQCI
jgi:hypothetical protein